MHKISILGCGVIARVMARTLRMMRENGEPVELYACAARDMERAQEFAKNEGFAVAYGSYDELVADPDVELVYIATPHSHHAQHMKLCLTHGKSVLCEKAFTANAQQAREVCALAKEKNVLVAEAIWTRYMPSRGIIDGLIKSGEFGDVRLVMANLHYMIEDKPRIRLPELAGGALLDVGVYTLNFACMVLGEDPERVESSVEMMVTSVDRSESMTLYYPGGAVAQLTAGTACRSDRHCLIAGTKGYITVDNVNCPREIKLHLEADNYAPRDVPVPPMLTGYEYQVRACMKALDEGRIECPEMTHETSIRMMEIMDGLRAQWGVKYPFEKRPGCLL